MMRLGDLERFFVDDVRVEARTEQPGQARVGLHVTVPHAFVHMLDKGVEKIPDKIQRSKKEYRRSPFQDTRCA